MIIIKEYRDFLVDDDLNIYNKYTLNKIKPFKGSDGYMTVKLHMKSCKTCERVHVIYANCFIQNPNNYKYINHIDSNKLNNSLDNLEWCTNSYNVQHSYNNGNTTNSNPIIVFKNDKFFKEYNSIRECCKDICLDRHKVSRILKGELKENYFKDYIFKYK